MPVQKSLETKCTMYIRSDRDTTILSKEIKSSKVVLFHLTGNGQAERYIDVITIKLALKSNHLYNQHWDF